MDCADGYINGEDTLQALTTPRKDDLERADRRMEDRRNILNQENHKRRLYETRRKGEQVRQVKPRPNVHTNLTVEGEENSVEEHVRKVYRPKYCAFHRSRGHDK